MLERVALVALLSAAGLAGFYLLRLTHVRRMSPIEVVTGVPTLLYFRSESCTVCPTQNRIVEQVAAAWHNRLIVEQVDAEAEPDKAGRYQVFTLPTTILLDGNGTVQRVNYGLADERKLIRQLAELDAVAV